MLTYRQQPPPAHLAPWVECIWTLTGKADAERETILPDGRIELIVHHGDLPRDQERSFVAGQISAPLHLFPNPGGTVSTTGIRLRPAAGSFLGMPAAELTGQFASIRLRAPTMLPDPAITYSVQLIEQSAGAVRMDKLTAAINMSVRHFDRRFLTAVGLQPKAFARIVRFQAVLAAYRAQDYPRWAELALQCGFYDQAHLSREFRQFAGEPPGGFFRNPGAWALLMANLSKTGAPNGAYDQNLCDF